jgi:glutamyl-tRNA synthetase
MIKLHTRIAPTPSGLLHLGNAWSFTLTWLAARATGGTLRLRIDDLDAARAQDEYLEDIFASLRWLGLDYDAGPRDAAGFKAMDSQRLRFDDYRAAAAALHEGGHLYACACSRARDRESGPLYPGTCRDLGLVAAEGHALRFRLSPAPVAARDADGGVSSLHPAQTMGDFVVVRRDGEPAYQLASVVDDTAHGVNFVVRGLDLIPSTGAQLALAAALDPSGLGGFASTRFWHHPLILDDREEKLSKSRGAESLAALRARFADPAPVFRWFAGALGLPPETARAVRTARDLLPGFTPARVPSRPLHLSDFRRFVGD